MNDAENAFSVGRVKLRAWAAYCESGESINFRAAFQARIFRAHADALDELAEIRAQLAERDAELARLKAHAEAMRGELADLIVLARDAMRMANRDGAEFDVNAECERVLAIIKAYRRDYPKEGT